jgi:predicted ATPase
LREKRLCVGYPLEALALPEVEAMIRATLDVGGPVSPELAASIHSRTGGNPFFVEELGTRAS